MNKLACRQVKPAKCDRTRSYAAIAHGFLLVLAVMPLTFSDGLAGTEKIATAIVSFDEGSPAGDMDFSPDGDFLAVDPWGNGQTDIWDIARNRLAFHVPGGGGGGDGSELIRFSQDGRLLAVCHGDGPSKVNIDLYDAVSGRVVNSLGDMADKEWNGGACSGIAFTRDGKFLVRIANRSPERPGDEVMFYSTATWQVVDGLRTSPYRPSSGLSAPADTHRFLIDPMDRNTSFFVPERVLASPDSKYLALEGMMSSSNPNMRIASGGLRYGIAILEIASHSLYRLITLPVVGRAQSMDWNPDSVHLAVAQTEAISVFDVRDGQEIVREHAESSDTLVRYSQDGKYLVESINKNVEIWDGGHRSLLQTIPKMGPACISMSRDGRYLALGGGDNNILDSVPLVSLIVHPHGGGGKVIVYKLK
jgi:WD40 repeat protein